MVSAEFQRIVEQRNAKTIAVLGKKEKEYSAGTDRFHNFKVAARMAGTTQEIAWRGMFLKHMVSIDDMVNGIIPVTPQLIDEKIGDAINYLILLEGILHERINNPA